MTKEKLIDLLTRLADGRRDSVEELAEAIHPLLSKPAPETKMKPGK